MGRALLLGVGLLWCTGSPPCLAQEQGAGTVRPEVAERWAPSLRTVGQDGLRIATAPFRLSRSDALHVAGLAGVTATLVATVDRPAYHGVQPGGDIAAFADAVAAPGDAYDRFGITRGAGLTAGAFALSGVVLQDRKMTRTSVRLAEALVFSRLATGALKTIVGRMRPFTGSGPHAADPWVMDAEHAALSFPSGHTSQAFALSTVIARTYSQWYVQVPAYGFAVSQAVQRVSTDKHWLSDVVAGAALGTFIGRVLTRSETASSSGGASAIEYRPILSTSRVGLSMHF
jgi:membrane-associated phospholipid phosphatase